MKKTCTHSLFIISLCLLVGVSFSSCDINNVDHADIETARLVVSGVVTYADGSKANGIKVSIYGVRAETEFADMNTYNYAITDTKGEYTIIRYLFSWPVYLIISNYYISSHFLCKMN